MLKTNSKKARENIRAYIMNGYNGTNYSNAPDGNDFDEIARFIYDTFKAEKFYSDNYYLKHKISEQESFIDWCAGLPSIIDTCYYYNRSALDDLANILEETDAEKAKYTEEQAEKMLSYLIFREIERSARK